MWTAFLLAGLPSNYFLDWSFDAQLWFIVVVPTIVLIVIVQRRTRDMPANRVLDVACLTAFYFTAPLLAYDWIYLGLHQGRGWSFIETHWYLTSFYFTPWLTLPFLAALAPRTSIDDRQR
jgi:hypothetical protein